MEHRRPPGEHNKTIVPSNNQPPNELTKPFSLDELATGVSLLKPAKAAGLDDLLTIFYNMLAHVVLNECTRTEHIPSIWMKAGDSHRHGSLFSRGQIGLQLSDKGCRALASGEPTNQTTSASVVFATHIARSSARSTWCLTRSLIDQGRRRLVYDLFV